MEFKPLPAELIQDLLNQKDENGRPLHQDILTAEATKEETFFRHARCPKCREADTEAFVDPKRPFLSGSILPNRHLRCIRCGTEFDPYSGLILKATALSD